MLHLHITFSLSSGSDVRGLGLAWGLVQIFKFCGKNVATRDKRGNYTRSATSFRLPLIYFLFYVYSYSTFLEADPTHLPRSIEAEG